MTALHGQCSQIIGAAEKTRQILGLGTIKGHHSGVEFFFPRPDGRCQQIETTFTKDAMAKQFRKPGEELGLSFGNREVGWGTSLCMLQDW